MPSKSKGRGIDYDGSKLCPSIRPDVDQTFLGDVGNMPDFDFEYMSKQCSAMKSFRCSIRYMSQTLYNSRQREARADANGGVNKYSTPQLQTVVSSLTQTLTDPDMGYGSVGKVRYSYEDITFESRGCTWEATVYPTVAIDAGNSRNSFKDPTVADPFRIRIVASAVPGKDPSSTPDKPNIVGYFVDVMFLPPDRRSKGSVKDTEKLLIAKDIFEEVGLDVKKAVVKCEFPAFPEGCQGNTFREIYQLNARLKSGSFATVCRGTHRITGKKVAIKCVLRKELPPSDDAAIYDEVAILASLRHQYVVPLIDFFEEKDCYFIIMELMAGGDLFDRIGLKTSYSEKDARDLCRKMLEAMKYCHDFGVAHCDMKPKNLLLKSDENDSYIKLADFGFAARVHAPKTLTKQCGTPFFVAPEILTRAPYDHQSDLWSCGAIMYLLLSGNLPFMARSQKELFRKIVIGKFEFPDSDWGNVSEEAKDLVRGLLVTDPDQRMTAVQALNSPWIRESGKKLQTHTLLSASERLKTFNARMKLRSAMIAVDWISSMTRKTSWVSERSLKPDGSPGPAKNNNASEPQGFAGRVAALKMSGGE